MAEPSIELKPDIDKPDIVEIDIVQPAEPVIVNTAKHFFTNEKYKVRDDLINWVRSEAAKVGFTVVIEKSDNGSGRRKQFFILGCERGGTYKVGKKRLTKEDTGSRKCQCPFRLRGYFLASQEWSLSVVCGEHNHKMDKKLEGHMIAGRLKPEEKKFVHEMTRNLVPPRNILNTLKDRSTESKSAIKQIYNERQRLKKFIRGTRSEMQQLLKCLEDHKYVYKIRTVGESTTVQDIFWAHPDSVRLFNTFPTVLLMDSTYKTNRYKMPLFEIVGVTSTEMSYNIGFAFIANEKEENFTWVLEMCLTLLKCKDIVPKVVVTDRDTALMSAVVKVFPNSTVLVCQYHISKNVRAKCKKLCSSKEVKPEQLWNIVMGAWEEVMYSPSEESYVDAVVQFRK
ncbi:protein FAR1-RELATED SEQUENCE 5-like, partial [Trifolium medium]|nr:protein FAR1-RELATED SEQUENCE 5-like [Trifolium medium]